MRRRRLVGVEREDLDAALAAACDIVREWVDEGGTVEDPAERARSCEQAWQEHPEAQRVAPE